MTNTITITTATLIAPLRAAVATCANDSYATDARVERAQQTIDILDVYAEQGDVESLLSVMGWITEDIGCCALTCCEVRATQIKTMIDFATICLIGAEPVAA